MRKKRGERARDDPPPHILSLSQFRSSTRGHAGHRPGSAAAGTSQDMAPFALVAHAAKRKAARRWRASAIRNLLVL
ncbi:unnamed protein product, partial [Phaeothamnion confervicola]